MHVVIGADGGPDIGYGHLVRTGALAEKLLSRGHEVTYATTTPRYVGEVCPGGVDTVELDSRTAPDELAAVVQRGVDVTVLDSYEADAEYQQRVRRETPLVVVADDTRHAVCADVLVNGNLYADSLEYDVVGSEPTWCLGPEYVLLREEIQTLAGEGLVCRETAERAVVTFGGSDVANLTPAAVRAFDGLPVAVTAVLGPGVSDDSSVRAAASDVDVSVSVLRDPPDFAGVLHDADFAVSACGSTTYELLALGTPMVCTPVVENQKRIATALSERDLAKVVDAESFRVEVHRAVRQYARNATPRCERARRGQNLVDGRGAERVCRQTLSVARENGEA
jgi:UDP-2,4-diacetamido-2,4,6-trideoxy-beta-L-altropyranose hydrolase